MLKEEGARLPGQSFDNVGGLTFFLSIVLRDMVKGRVGKCNHVMMWVCVLFEQT